MEWLGDVVVGTKIEPSHPIVFGGSRREHHNRHSGLLPKTLADLLARYPGNHQVENYEDDALTARHFEAIDAVASDGRFVAGLLQVLLKRVRNYGIVLNDHDFQAVTLFFLPR